MLNNYQESTIDQSKRSYAGAVGVLQILPTTAKYRNINIPDIEKISRLRKETESMNLEPNIWFKNVEIVAAKRIGRETVEYVNNIYKYYIAYKYIVNRGHGM